MICASFKLRSLFMRSLINFQCNSCNKSQKGVYLHHNKSQKGVLYKEQISQKGVKGITMKRKIYQQLLDWKEKRNGEVAQSRF